MRINVIGWVKGDRPSFWARTYRGAVVLIGFLAFLVAWIASVFAAGFVGFMLGWIPSILVGAIVGIFWPLLALGAIALPIYIYVPPLVQSLMEQAAKPAAESVEQSAQSAPVPDAQSATFLQICRQANRFRKYTRDMPESIRSAIVIPDSLARDELNWLRAMKAEFDQLDAFVALCDVTSPIVDEPALSSLCKAAPPSAEIEILWQNESTKRQAARLELLRRTCDRRNVTERSDQMASLCSDMAAPWSKALIQPDSAGPLRAPPTNPDEKAAAQADAINDAKMRVLLDRLRVVCGFPSVVPSP